MDACLFDLDGTLADSRVDVALSANHARRAVGLEPLALEEIYGFIGEGARRLIERTLGVEHAGRADEALAAWQEHYEAHMLDHTRLFPGVRQALAAIALPRAIVTNKPGDSARALVKALGLAPLCPVVVGGGDVATKKPEPEGVRRALELLGAGGRAVLVGDSRVDAATARQAGLGFVGVLWGLGTREEMEREGGRLFVARPDELPGALQLQLAARG